MVHPEPTILSISPPQPRARTTEPTVTVSAERAGAMGQADLIAGFMKFPVWIHFALHDIRHRFRRSVLGPFWITLNMGIMVGALLLVFEGIFHQQVADALPHIATGLIFWGLLTSCITDGTTVFIVNESFIRNVPLPISTHLFRMLARNVIIWAFNMAIYAIVLVVSRPPVGASYLLFIPGFALFLLNVAWISLVVAVLSTRYRDIPQIVANLLQVAFFVTPVFWSAAALSGRPLFVTFNPLYHLIELVRAPLLGAPPSLLSWVSSVLLAVAGVAATTLLYRRAFSRIPYWV